MAASSRTILYAAVAVAAFLAAVALVWRFPGNGREAARAGLLGFVPADATSVIYIDAAQLRTSPFLATLYAWAPRPAEESEYAQFVADTGFDYERDLFQVFIARSNRGAGSTALVIAEGKFDRRKIEAYLGRNSSPVRQANLTIFPLTARSGAKAASFAFLSDRRVAVSDSGDLPGVLAASLPASSRAEWQARFDRLAGSPVFAVIRQDPAIQTLAANQSPQLAAFVAQLPWITLAAKPDGDLLRVVAEGETITDTAASQLRDFLEGIELLAQGGLNDPKLRRQMDPDERAAYVELLQGIEIDKIARGTEKSVRVVVPVTERFLKIAKIPAAGVARSPGEPGRQAPAAEQAKPLGKK